MNPITTLRVYMKIRKPFEELQKDFQMPFSWHLVIQMIGLFVQILNGAGDLFPSTKAKLIIAGVVGVLQALAALFGQFNNPDGTPAAQSYVSGKLTKEK